MKIEAETERSFSGLTAASLHGGTMLSAPADFEAGVFLVDKPPGPTSFKMVQAVRGALNIKKVGHAGTLDPFASGLLVICAGRPATRLIQHLMDGDKEYEATLQLGIETETHDPEGKIVRRQAIPQLDERKIEAVLAGFLGEQLQEPPRFSALKYNGKPLYYYARKGIEVKKAPRRIEIKELDLLAVGCETITMRVLCSKGTYIRTLAADIGSVLGCGAHLVSLRRTASGPFSVSSSLPGAELLDGKEKSRELLREHALTIDEVQELLAG